MTKEQAKHLSEVLKAYSEGKSIETRAFIPGGGWSEWITVEYLSSVPLNDENVQLRVKPEPKLRPYKDAKEFLQAQKEHGIYVRLKNINEVHYTLPTDVDDKEIMFADVSYTYESCMNNLYWQDGAPCGILEE